MAGITSGNLGLAIQGAVTSYLSAAAMFAVGENFASGSLPNIAGHAAVGCLSSMVGGGRCGPGALSGAVSAAAGPLINGRGLSVRSIVANAVVGGLASVAGGGKFANGAVTAAYGYLFNDVLHSDEGGGSAAALRELGPSVRTNADGTQTFCYIEGCFTDGVRSPSPLDPDDPLVLLGAAGAFKGALWAMENAVYHAPYRMIAGYEVFASSGLVGTTYNFNIWWVGRTEGSEGLVALANALRAEASAAGASEISILGLAVRNQGFLSPQIAARMGFTFQQVNPQTVILQGLLK